MIRSISLATITLITLVVLATGIVSAAPRQQIAVNICSRTAQAQTAILDKVPEVTCSTITDTQLAAITELIVTGYSNASLVPGDFAGLPGLTNLSINNSPTLTNIPADAFSEVTGLTRLELKNDTIASVNVDAFGGLASLQILNLFGNQIATLDTNTFAELQNLTDLTLSANVITELDQDIFDGLTSLTSLGLSGNQITELDQDTFDGLTNLTNLGVSGNQITELDQDIFDGLDNLQRLNLASNMLSILDEDIFDGLTELTLLDFGSNKITTMHTDTFEGITKLETLDFRNNPITNLDEDIFDGLINLQTLNFENLDITTLDGNIFDGLTSLKSLEFIGNRITTLEQGIFQPITTLTNLDLTGNSITSLDGNIFSSLTNLTTLKLPNNKITTLHQDTFDGLDNLVELNLANNRIATLPVGSFADLTSLQDLNLVCNFLKEINLDRFDTFATTLTTLNIRYNNFATEPNPTDIHARLTNLGNLVHGPRDEGARCVTPTIKVGIAASAYSVTEGNTQTITFTLDRDPERQVTIPLIATKQGGASSDDYSGVPANLTFNRSETQKSFDFTATQDDEDDDGESVKLTFGTLPAGVNPATTNETTVRINDDDDPEITVSFGASAHTIPEDGMQEVTITLSAEPERSVKILITVDHQGGASSADYSGVPDSMTFTSSETQKSFTFNATQDTEDDDDESVKLEFGSLPHRVTAGTTSEVTIRITDDDDPRVEVSFGAATYTVPEGQGLPVTIILSADPERTVVIPLTAMEQDGASSADYSGIPSSLTFNTGQTQKSFTFTATQDTMDDDDESVKLAFSTNLPSRVSTGTPHQTTVRITDDDDPQVTVMFAQTSYLVAEGETVTVRVALSADPERTVTIPLVTANQDGASSADYSGVPSTITITINANESSKTFEFMATEDDTTDPGESVKLTFGTSLPPRVTPGTPNEATVTINQVYGQFGLDCSEKAAVWCADLELSDRVSENYGWLYMRYGQGWDPPAHLSPDNFTFRGAHHIVRSMELRPGTHPVLPNAWSRWQQGYSSFGISIQSRGGLPRANYQDWILHLDELELPFKDALRSGSSFVWVGPEIQQIFNDWTPQKVNRIGIQEVAAANQNTNPMLPWTPMQVDAVSEGPNRLRIIWAKPNWYHRGLPAPTKYIVQWKLASASWSDSAAISQREVAATSNFESLAVKGLNEDTFYSVRVIASNDSGDGPPSPETLGRPQDHTPKLIARTVNGDTLTLRFSNRLDTTSVPAETAFTVIADGGLIMVDSMAIRGDEVILTLDRPVTAATHSVKVRYDRPTDTTARFLRDTNSNHVHIRQHHELLQAVNVTPQSSVQPLTAEFTNHPASHDGSTRFAFEIEFSEPVWISDGLARDDMLRVTGGTVISAHWKDRRTDIFRVEIQPRTNGDIIITLPGNQHCDSIIAASGWTLNTPIPGTPCAIGNRSLTREVTETIPGPSSPSRQQQALEENIPAEGRLGMNGLPELGQTLSADTSEITDTNELHDTVFRYQWIADGADILGADGPRYTLVRGDLGSEISLRVNFTDDAGYQESITSAAKTISTTGLQLQSATVDGVTLTLTYNEVLHTDIPLSRTAFSVSVNGASRSLSNTAASETNVMLSLSEAVAAGDTVTVDYTVPEGQNFIQDIRGRRAASFSQQTVNNHTARDQERTPPDSLQATIHDQPSSHNGQDAFTFELEFSEEPDLSYTTVRDHAFTVTGGSVTYVRRLEPGRNIGWKIHVTPNGNADVTLSLRSTTDCSAQGAICTEDGRKLSGGLLTSIPGPNTPATGAPAITGTPRVGGTLTAVTSSISDQDGMDDAVFRYQWLAAGADIPGATGSSYQVANEDEGLTIRLRVSFTDDGGNREALSSQATGLVVPRATPPAPRNLTAVVNGDGHIVLSWDAPDDDSITSYRILRRRPTLGEDTLLVYVADTQRPAATYTDTDITTGVQHVYRVKAINAAGTGPVSNYVNVTP